MPKKETEVLCKIQCARCGKEDYVPFVANGSRNYYCAACLQRFNSENKRGIVKKVFDSKGKIRFEFICDACEQFIRSPVSPKRNRNRLLCAECDEKEKRLHRTTRRKRVILAKKEG